MTQNTHDKLEKFVSQNKEAFDELTPNENVWKGIQSQITVPTKFDVNLFFWKAAAVLLFVCSIGLTLYVNKDSLASFDQVSQENSEFNATENYYSAIIIERQNIIKSVAMAYPEIENDFEMDWKLLDANYTQLKKEFAKNKNQAVLNALVQNLQSRANLLNKQIEIVNQMNTDKNKSVEI